MSLYDYRMSQQISVMELPYYALLMALMRAADDDNGHKLRTAFPAVWRELQLRYLAPKGVLPGEKSEEQP